MAFSTACYRTTVTWHFSDPAWKPSKSYIWMCSVLYKPVVLTDSFHTSLGHSFSRNHITIRSLFTFLNLGVILSWICLHIKY